MNRAATRSLLLITTVLLLAGCDFGFLTDSADEEPPPGCDTTYTMVNLDEDEPLEREARDCEGTLLWWEDYAYNDAGAQIATRRHRPDDTIRWTRLFDYEDEQETLEAYYLPDGEAHLLQWQTVRSYEGEAVAMEATYDGTGALQWFEAHEYSPEGLETYHGRFGGGVATPLWLYAYFYDGENRIEKEEAYTSVAETAEVGAGSASALSSEPDLRLSASQEAYAFGLSLPEPTTLPEDPDLEATTEEMELSWTQKWWYQERGWFSMKYDQELRPLLLTIEDEALSKQLTVSVSYNEENLPTRKVTSYGDDEVLALGFEYNENALIERITSSGRSLLVPMDYEIAYNDENVPSAISIYQGDTLLQRLEYSYVEGGARETVVEPDGSFDPIDFGGRIDSVTQYDGDDNRLGTYRFSYNVEEGEIRIDAYEYEPETDGERANGHFLIELNAEGRTASFSSFSADNERLWHYSYEYDEAGNRIREARYDAEDLLSVVESFDIELLFE